MGQFVRGRVFDFVPGLNKGVNRGALQLGEHWNISNFHPHKEGLVRRRGFALATGGTGQFQVPTFEIPSSIYNTAPVSSVYNQEYISSQYVPITTPTGGGAAPFMGVWVRKPIAANVQLLSVLGNSLKVTNYDGQEWVAHTTTPVFASAPTELVSMVDFGNYTIIGSAGLAPKKYDGTVITDLGGSPPSAAVFSTFEGFVFAGNLNPDNITGEIYRNGFRWSGQQQPEQWDDNLYITAGLKIVSQCPSDIQWMCPINDEIVIGHQSEIQSQRFIGGAEIFRTNVISTNVGSLGKLTYYSTFDAVVFLGHDNIYLYSQGVLTPVDLEPRVYKEIFALPNTVLETARFYFDRQVADLWMFLQTSPPRAYVFNLHYNNWTRHDYDDAFYTTYPFTFVEVYPLDFRPYFLGADANIYTFAKDLTTDNGSPITSIAEGVTDFGDPSEKESIGVHIIADGTGDITVGLSGLNNPNATPDYETQTLTLSTDPMFVPFVSFPNIRGRYFAYKIETASPIRFAEIDIIFNLSGVGRG